MTEERVAIVTGASKGIGKQMAIELARKGVSVVLAARTAKAGPGIVGGLDETRAAVEAQGVRAIVVPTDLSSASDLDRLVATTVKAFGRVDALINNAAHTNGPTWAAPLTDLSTDDWLYQFAVNLHAPFSLTKAVIPHMRAHGKGVVINVASLFIQFDCTQPRPDGDLLPVGSPLGYATSKTALNVFSNIVAPQLRQLGISLITLIPGAVRTEMVEEFIRSGAIPAESVLPMRDSAEEVPRYAPAGSDAIQYIPMSVPAKATAYLATCANPLQYSGNVVTAQHLVDTLRL